MTVSKRKLSIMVSEYDERQLSLMRGFIASYENDNLNLLVLINSLRGLLDVLEVISLNWKNKFKTEWWTLEQVYAICLSQERKSLNEEEIVLIQEAICNMKKLLKEIEE
jgi:hypothetical protein